MPTSVERVPGEPIIIITIQGHLDAHIMRDVYDRVARLGGNVEPPVYRITDVREMDVTLADMVEIIKDASRGFPGSPTDPRIVNVFVGKSHMSRFAADMHKLRRFGGVSTVLMNTMDDALAYVRLKARSRPQGEAPCPSP